MTHVEAYTKVWVEGQLVASSHAESEHIPSMMTADALSVTTLRATRQALAVLAAKYPTSEEDQHG